MQHFPGDPAGPVRSWWWRGAGMLVLGALALGAPSLSGQQQTAEQDAGVPSTDRIVSRAVTFGTEEAAIVLETADGDRIDIAFRDGVVSIGDEPVGAYEPGGALEDSWRTLLARAVQLDDGPLARALVEWTPPADPSGTSERIDAALEEALMDRMAADAPPGAAVEASSPDATLAELLSRIGSLAGLEDLMRGVDVRDLHVVVGEDFEVAADQVVDGSVLVVDGDADVRGRIRGSLLVADGDVELREGAVVDGDVRIAGGFLDRSGGRVVGDLDEIELGAFVLENDLRDRIRAEVREEMAAQGRSRQSRSPGVFRRVGRSIGDVIDTLLTAFVLGILGILILHFGGDRLDRIAETARRSPGRAALVGGAGAFLSLPVWILGAVGLAVTIIGIPAAIVWLPAFPLAVGLALVVGYTAVARNVGSWLSRQDYPGFDWVLVTRPNTLVFGGILLLMAPFLLAHVVDLGGGLLQTLQDLLTAAGFLMGLFATLAGFGAVLITRGGRRETFTMDDIFSDATFGWGFGRGRDDAPADPATEPPPPPRTSAEEEFDREMARTRKAPNPSATDPDEEPVEDDEPVTDVGESGGTTDEPTDSGESGEEGESGLENSEPDDEVKS